LSNNQCYLISGTNNNSLIFLFITTNNHIYIYIYIYIYNYYYYYLFFWIHLTRQLFPMVLTPNIYLLTTRMAKWLNISYYFTHIITSNALLDIYRYSVLYYLSRNTLSAELIKYYRYRAPSNNVCGLVGYYRGHVCTSVPIIKKKKKITERKKKKTLRHYCFVNIWNQ
jgi:hypothetical protein